MRSVLNTHTVLYVEDEPEIQASIGEYLNGYFASVYLANDGFEALAKYKMYHPDVIILDIELPQMDGLSVAQKIRELDQSVKIMMLSGSSDKQHLLLATELKLTKYLLKPVSPKAFKEALNTLGRELLQNPSRFHTINDVTVWDKEKQCLEINEKAVFLTEKERRLLNLFVNYSKQLITYEKIITTVWDDVMERDISVDSVKNQVSKLRQKLPSGCLTSIYGEGYTLQ